MLSAPRWGKLSVKTAEKTSEKQYMYFIINLVHNSHSLSSFHR